MSLGLLGCVAKSKLKTVHLACSMQMRTATVSLFNSAPLIPSSNTLCGAFHCYRSLWFKHYDLEQLKQIIRTRLGDDDIFEPMALSLVAEEVRLPHVPCQLEHVWTANLSHVCRPYKHSVAWQESQQAQAPHSVCKHPILSAAGLPMVVSPFRPHDTLADCCSSCFHELLCLPFSASRTTVLLHGQVENGASSDVRELLVVCSKAVNYAKSKSCKALADLEPGTSSAVDSTGGMLPWTPSTLPHYK